VFPWVIADYESEELDLNDPSTYRDLSKPMVRVYLITCFHTYNRVSQGAIGPQRAIQFRERYEALASTYFGEDDPPPFHYGTHYSCAAYVLYYLMRLEPFSRLALALQGGRFDVADRLFHDVGRSWRSASSENLQDVRELIPEFYYLPDFLVNTNHFDFGETQRGKTVHDVTLPKWAKDDPKRFVRINRQALESEYVSRNLHLWLDLVFGHKQRGDEAIACLNTFVHVTYEGEVDIDSMTDPVQRQSTIAQIQNFGQTPSRLERKPFPQRTMVLIVKDNAIDFSSVAALVHLTPPLCVVGAPSRIRLSHVCTEQCRIGRVGVSDTAIGEISYAKGQLLAVPKLCALAIPMKKYFSFGGVNNGVTVHAAAITGRFREVNKLLSIHDDMHRSPIVAAKASLNGDWLVTGSVDSTIRVWFYDGTQLHLQATFCGHDGSRITCIDVSVECGVIVTGCSHGRVLLWDLRTLTFVRALQAKGDKATLSASINHKTETLLLWWTLSCLHSTSTGLLWPSDNFRQQILQHVPRRPIAQNGWKRVLRW
jgi:Beige/BEACH domain/WD domain, G-beta repeat